MNSLGEECVASSINIDESSGEFVFSLYHTLILLHQYYGVAKMRVKGEGQG